MKVLVTGRLPEEIMELIKKEHQVAANEEDRPMEREKLLMEIGDKEGLLCMITDGIDEELLDKAPRLRMIANYGVGFNNIDLESATEKGIPVSNTPGVLTEATADITFALILSTARRIVEGDRRTRQGKFKFWAPSHFLGREVSGKTLGIVGLGRIGKAVARRARGFDMRILYSKRRRLNESEERDLGVAHVDLDTLLEQSDFVSLHVPLSEATHHLISHDEIRRMKPTAYLINTARGPILDEQALIRAIQNREIAGAGLDVYENEPELMPGLSSLDNVILLPHVGSATLETRTRMARLAAENLLSGLRGEMPPNCLNCESISMKR